MSDKTILHAAGPQELFAARYGRRLAALRIAETAVLLTGIAVVLIHAGFRGVSSASIREVDWLAFAAMAVLTACRLIRFVILKSIDSPRVAFIRAGMLIPVVWAAGTFLLLLMGHYRRHEAITGAIWTQGMLCVLGVQGALLAARRLAVQTRNSAVLLVGSFLTVIAVGTGLLMLPVCREGQQAAEWDVALFTATSASCVTGLIVKPTGSYWSPVGHAVIFCLFQIGGLGILTFGAFIAVLSGRRGLNLREARTFRDILDSDSVKNARRLLLTILLFTFGVELVGAVLLSGLWSDRPPLPRAWYSVFHAVSAFCNAGFSLHDDGFLGMGNRWQVLGPLSLLIILGGLGFPVIYDLYSTMRRRLRQNRVTPLFGLPGIRPRTTVHTRLVLMTTAGLLLFGTVFWFLLESLEAPPGSSSAQRAADAWFQSVTFRTAGFNTVDHRQMHPATKLLAVFLMFIGAAPGSTGGGVKTIVFAVTVLNIRAVFRGQEHVEVFGRRIPAAQVSRSLAMIAFGLLIVMVTTGLLVVFERQPDRFLDHMYEAASAFGTVGVSAGVTGELTLPSRLLICVVMFLGRVGPVTLLLAMAANSEPARYDYPEERVSLG